MNLAYLYGDYGAEGTRIQQTSTSAPVQATAEQQAAAEKVSADTGTNFWDALKSIVSEGAGLAKQILGGAQTQPAPGGGITVNGRTYYPGGSANLFPEAGVNSQSIMMLGLAGLLVIALFSMRKA